MNGRIIKNIASDKSGNQVVNYPATISDAVINTNTGNTITEDLKEISLESRVHINETFIGYINGDGNIQTQGNDPNYTLYTKLKVKCGERYHIKTKVKISSVLPAIYAIYSDYNTTDSSTLIQIYRGYDKLEYDEYIDIPNGANALLIGMTSYLLTDINKIVIEKEKSIQEIILTHDNTIYPNDSTANKNTLIGDIGTTVNFNNNVELYYYTRVIYTQEGCSYLIKGEISSGKMWAFLDINKKVISCDTNHKNGIAYNNENKLFIKAPKNAYYLVINFYNFYTEPIEVTFLNKKATEEYENAKNLEKINIAINEVNPYIDFIEMNTPLGVLDNYAQDVLLGSGIHDLKNGQGFKSKGKIEKDNNGYTKIELVLNDSMFVVVKIKKTGHYVIVFTATNGAKSRYWLDDNTLVEGNILYDRLGDGSIGITEFGQVLENNEEYLTVLLRKSDNNDNNRKFIITMQPSLSISDTSQLHFIIDESMLGLFYSKDIDKYVLGKYKSRSQKLNSPVRGKSAIVYSDSLSKFMEYLAYDWGMIIYSIASGGCRMGYESGAGAGGETGTANKLWLCNDSSIQTAKSILPNNIDYIINMAGSNGTLQDIPSSTEIQYCYNNKRWYDSDNSTNPFDSLSNENKARFTSTVCYIVSAYSLAQIYPNVQLVVVEPYFIDVYRNFSNKKWDNIANFANVAINISSKSAILKSIADGLRAIFVPNNSFVGKLNAPYYTDGVHPEDIGISSKAASIARALEMPGY